jgi:hypothetical protein
MPSTVLFIDRFSGEGPASRAFKQVHVQGFLVASWRSSYIGPQCEIIFESTYLYIIYRFLFYNAFQYHRMSVIEELTRETRVYLTQRFWLDTKWLDTKSNKCAAFPVQTRSYCPKGWEKL